MFVVGVETRALFDEIYGGIPVAEHGEADDGGEAGGEEIDEEVAEAVEAGGAGGGDAVGEVDRAKR